MFGPMTLRFIASSSVRYSLMETGSLWLFSLRKKSISIGGIVLSLPTYRRQTMTVTLGPLISLIAGILILVMPRLLNYIVALYLIIFRIVGLFAPIHIMRIT